MNAYVSQIWPDGSGHEGCGPALVASALLSWGWNSDPYGLYREVYDHINDTNGTTSQQLLNELDFLGFDGRIWWEWDAMLEDLARGGAIFCLVQNKYLTPRAYPNAPGWNATHWVRLVSIVDGDHAYIYDPLCYMVQPNGTKYQGPTIVTVESLREAIRNAPVVEGGIVTWMRA